MIYEIEHAMHQYESVEEEGRKSMYLERWFQLLTGYLSAHDIMVERERRKPQVRDFPEEAFTRSDILRARSEDAVRKTLYKRKPKEKLPLPRE